MIRQFSLSLFLCFICQLALADKAFDDLLVKAQSGDLTSQMWLGSYFYSKGDSNNAYIWFKKSADQGNAAAQYSLASMYSNGNGVTKSQEEAVNLFTQAAKQGHLLSIIALAGSYHLGLGVERDYSKAFYWYSKGAEQGGDSCKKAVAYMLYKGEGVKQDYKKAFDILIELQNSNKILDGQSQLYLAEMYYYGRGVEIDYKKTCIILHVELDHSDGDPGEYDELLEKACSKLPPVERENAQAEANAMFLKTLESPSSK